MKITDDDRGQGPQNPFAAVADIRRRNAENSGNFTQAKKDLAVELRALAIEAHQAQVYPPNYRVTEITVKVEGYRARDKLRPEYDKLVAFCDKHKIDARLTAASSMIYIIKP